MNTHRLRTKYLLRSMAAIVLPSLALTACKTARYASLGIDGIDSENAPYVHQRVLALQDELKSLAHETWEHALGIAVAGKFPECSDVTYGGTEGPLTEGATLMVALNDCSSGRHLKTIEFSFGAATDGIAPRTDSFSARVHYTSTRSDRITIDATFNLSFVSQGGEDPLSGDHAAASWRIEPAADGEFVIRSLSGGEAVLDDLHCHFGELRMGASLLANDSCSYVLLDGKAGVPLEVRTPMSFKQYEDDAFPYEGKLVVKDVDGMQTVLEAGLIPDALLIQTYELGGEESVQENITWEELDAAERPREEETRDARATVQPGWL
jgi:hypothetical protein